MNPAAATAVDRQVRRLLIVAAVAALVAAGCGGSEEDDVKHTVTDYFKAMGDGDGKRACALITPPSREKLGGADCAEIVSASAKKLDASDRKVMRDVDIGFTTVTIHGDRAFMQSDPDDNEPIQLQKIDGKWLVDQTE